MSESNQTAFPKNYSTLILVNIDPLLWLTAAASGACYVNIRVTRTKAHLLLVSTSTSFCKRQAILLYILKRDLV